MAICHISISIISRGKGKTAVAAAAYRAGERIVSEYDGRINSYIKKRGIVHKEIMLPGNAPCEYSDRSILWNSVERAERYKTAQLAREIVIALPIELTREQNISLAREYVRKNFVDAGMCADLCVHDTGGGNPHAHIMLTMRALDEDGNWMPKSHSINGKKMNTVDWNDRDKAEQWRKAWADLQNEYLRKQNINIKVDHRSYKRQGIDQIPTIHLGVEVSQMEKRGIRTRLGDINRGIAVTNNELRQLKARIRKSKDELYSLPLIDAPSMLDAANAAVRWRSFGSQYEKVRNLKEYVNVVNFILANDIRNIGGVAERAETMCDEARNLSSEVKKIDRRMQTLSMHLMQYETYRKHLPVVRKFNELKGRKRDAFYGKHRNAVDDFCAAKQYLEKVMNAKGKPPVKEWEAEMKKLQYERWSLCDKYYNLRREIKAVEKLRQGVERVMGEVPMERERELQQSRDVNL